MAKVVIKGGPDLKIRLTNVARSGEAIQEAWAKSAADQMRATAPRSTGRLARSIEPRWRSTSFGATGAIGVFGAYWGVFMDRGTKAHSIQPRDKKALKFDSSGRTVFAAKVMRRRMPRRPFATAAAQAALRDAAMTDEILKAWSRKTEKKSFRKLKT